MIDQILTVLQSVGSFIVAIGILLFMVTVHEFGHYVAGKKLGFKINEFSVGFGPAIFKRKVKSGEDFSLRCIPLGGYCAFEGEDEASSSPDSFEKKEPWKRIVVLAAGATANIIATVLIVILAFCFSGQYFAKVETVLPSPAGEFYDTSAVFEVGDYILEVEGKTAYSTTVLTSGISNAISSGEDTIDVVVFRDGEKQNVTIELRTYENTYFDSEEGVYKTITSDGVGILIGMGTVNLGFFDSISNAFGYCGYMAMQIYVLLGELLTGALGIESLGGPVTTITMTASVVSGGLRILLELVALIGINLAVFNLLPIPALDGSKIIFTAIEWVRGKPINRNVESMIHFVGFVAIFAFAIYVDLAKLF